MFFLVDKIPNVVSFAVNTKGNCLYNDRQAVYKYDNKELIYQHKISLQEIHYRGVFCVNDLEGKGVFFDEHLNGFAIESYIYQYTNGHLIYINASDEERHTFVHNLETNQLFKIDSWSTKNYFSKSLIARMNFQSNEIQAFEFPSGLPLWQYDLIAFGTFTYRNETQENVYVVERFFGEAGDELLVGCSQGLILAINIKTGEETRRWRDFDRNGTKTSISRTDKYQLTKDRKLLITIISNYIIVIDLITDKITFHDRTQDLAENNMKHFRGHYPFSENDTHYFTSADMDMEKMNTSYIYQAVIAINKSTLKIDWHYTDPIFDLGANMPQLSGDKLHIRTRKKELYTFQREDSVSEL